MPVMPCVVAPALGQHAAAAARVAGTEENLRSTPGGARIATVLAAASLAPGEAKGPWREVTLQGWMPAGTLRRTGRPDYPVAVAAGGGAIHQSPGGTIIARGMPGLLLGETERKDDWVRVRRTAWIWSASLAAGAPAPQKNAPKPVVQAAATAAQPLVKPGAVATPAAAKPADLPAAPTPKPAASPVAAPARSSEIAILATPRGDTLAVLPGTAAVQVLARDGEWAKVRLEGWTRDPVTARNAGGSAIQSPSPRLLREDPDAYRGQTVLWTADFVALQRADSLRPDFTPGEPYMLVRDPNGEPGFAYVAVSPAQLAEIRRFAPLQKLRFMGRVRTGRSAMMGHPVLDLVEFRN